MRASGTPLDYISAFVGGLGISFTPCVYPLIPVTIGFIGVRAGESRVRGFLLSLCYVTGLALTYAALGLIASLTGKIFGTFTQNAITYFFVGIVLFVCSLSLFDIIVIPVPAFIKPPAVKKKNYFSALLVGATSGLIVGPCITPVLGSILGYLATKKDLLYGATLLFVFAFGMGSLLIVAGTFSGFLINLPRSGTWMKYITKFYALLLFGAAVYFIYTGIRRL